MRALVRELDGALGTRRPRVGVVALQDDKPVAAMLERARAGARRARRDDERARGPLAGAARRGARRRRARGGLRATSSPRRSRSSRSPGRASAPAPEGAVVVDRIALPARAAARGRAGGPLACARRRSLWRVFVLILGLILLTVAVFYAIGYALAKAIV